MTEATRETIKSAAHKLKGFLRRQFQAEVAQEYCDGSARQAERVFGWGREAVQTGLSELRTGFRCIDNCAARGRHKSEELDPSLVSHIRALVESESQADPKFQTPLAFTRITAKAVHRELVAQALGTDAHVPAERTVNDIPNRLGYCTRRVRKTKPEKKLPETDAIFENLKQVHAQEAQEPGTLHISQDMKAKVKVGEFLQGGVARGSQAVAATDHDMHPDAVLVPALILEVDDNQLNVIFGTSRDTSDLIVDCLELWWSYRQSAHPGVQRLLIDLDNGPEIASSRTQFMKRLVDFSDRSGSTIDLAYYPPYHSKYNRIERCWGILKNHWNGTLLSSVETRLAWAKSMT